MSPLERSTLLLACRCSFLGTLDSGFMLQSWSKYLYIPRFKTFEYKLNSDKLIEVHVGAILSFPETRRIQFIICRFQYEGMWRQKLQTNVSFPMSQLDMSNYVVGPRSAMRYNLHAVSNHYGTMHGGHYTAFAKSVYDKKWYKFDDQYVTEISPRDVVVSSFHGAVRYYMKCLVTKALNKIMVLEIAS